MENLTLNRGYKVALMSVRWITVFTGVLGASMALAGNDDLKLFIDRVPTPQEVAKNFTGAKFEPEVGCYLGAFIDLDYSLDSVYVDQVGKTRRLPSEFEQKTGRTHATYFYYMAYGSRTASDWIQKLGSEDKIVHIALEPNNGLQWVKDDEYLNELAIKFAATKTPIFLRFASEMNGTWTKYSGNSMLYKEKFQLVAKVMHEKAPNVAMVWCPYTTPTGPIESFYPGDKSVDWVGVNLYSVTYFDQNKNKPAAQIHPVEMLDYVYNKYSARKPIMVGEYGATHYSALEGKSVSDFAQRAIAAMYSSLPRAYPRVKCINYFNGNNLILDHRKNNNYAVTQDENVLKTYAKVVSEDYFLSKPLGTDFLLPVEEAIVPVDAQDHPLPQANWPEVAMPAKNGQRVTSGTMFSAWTQDHSGDVVMKFFVDGRVFWVGKNKEEWRVELDTRKLQNGKHEIKLVATKHGKVIGTQKVTVLVNN
ncbi:MAG: hypothetical protein KDC26_09670 [Armatimonadetes bacterium]|nr:hypothetical protein [Armatimonadota bacterium]